MTAVLEAPVAVPEVAGGAARESRAKPRPLEADPGSDRLAPAPTGVATAVALGLLLLTALPDSMLPPVLRRLFVERYGASVQAAHWFMAVNLLGAVLAVPALGLIRRRLSPVRTLVMAAILNAAVLAVLALPVGAAWSLLLRTAGGAADLVVFAVLFDLVGKGGSPRHRGRRLGVAGSVMMIGLAAGAVLGGAVGRHLPTLVFDVGAICCLLTAIGAVLFRVDLRGMVRSCPAIEIDPAHGLTHRPLWPALAMVAGDRALAGLLAVTIPLLLASAVGLDSAQIGRLVAMPLALMALGAWPAGWLGDRIGHLRLRVVAAILYAAAMLVVPLTAAVSIGGIVTALILVGLGGAALLPTSMAIASRSGRGAVAMGAWHGAGNVGFFLGISAAGMLLGAFGGDDPPLRTYLLVIAGFSGVHVVITIASALALRRTPVDAPVPAPLAAASA